MTEEQKKLGRRNFIKAVAAIPPAGALVWKASSMTPIRAGIIGTGSQGRVLMENAPPSHIRLSAVCDIYPKNLEKGLTIARERFDPQAESYTDYRKLLERKDLEAILIATPMWQHEPMAVDALQAGKHTFSEKAMAHSIEGCRRMIDAAHSARRTLQVGHHRNYNPLYQEAYQLIRGGVIGDVYHVRALWHRNKSWRRKLPKGDFDPTAWGYGNLDEYKNWRLYRKFGHGLMGELGSHQIQVVNWFSGRLPHSVYGSGGTYHYNDDREVEDHVYLIYEYPEGLTFTYSSIQTNSYDHYYEQFMGTKGTILLSGEREAMLFSEGGEAAATELAAAPMGEGPVMEASESRANDAAGSSVGGKSSMALALRGYQNELAGFARIIRHGADNLSDGPMAMNVVIPMIKGNESIAKGEKVEIPPELYWT